MIIFGSKTLRKRQTKKGGAYMSLRTEIWAELEKLIDSHRNELPKNGFTMTYKESNIEVTVDLKIIQKTILDCL